MLSPRFGILSVRRLSRARRIAVQSLKIAAQSLKIRPWGSSPEYPACPLFVEQT